MTAEAAQSRDVDFDVTDPDLAERLYDFYDEVRERCPVAHVDRHGGYWMLTKHEDVSAVARDYSRFTTTGAGVMIPPIKFGDRALPVESDPPEHTALRKVLMPFFTRRAIAQHAEPMRRIVVELIDEIAPLGEADLVPALAEQIPPIVLAMLLGIPETDWPRMRALTVDMLRSRYESPSAAATALAAFESYTNILVDVRSAGDGDDLVSVITHAVIDGCPISRSDAHGLVHMLIGAGHETTVNGISNILYHLVWVDGLLDKVREDRNVLSTVIEESLRFDSPVQFLARTALADTEVSGTPIKSGDRLALMWGAASRDPQAFDAPAEFRWTREQNRHLAFGIGHHRCIGEHLARLEMQIVAEEVVQRLPGLRLAGEPRWRARSNNRGLSTLPVRFDPAHTPPTLKA
jgi:cytochrome P450